MKHWYLAILALVAVTLSGPHALADISPVPSPSPVVSVAPAAQAIAQLQKDSQAQSLDIAPFVADAAQGLKAVGGASGMAKLAIILLLLIASMKVNLINKNLWSKIPDKLKGWLAPALGLVSGVVLLPHLSLPGVLAYAASGGGAVALHELLDLAKGIPGIGPIWVSIIGVIEGALSPAPAQASQ